MTIYYLYMCPYIYNLQCPWFIVIKQKNCKFISHDYKTNIAIDSSPSKRRQKITYSCDLKLHMICVQLLHLSKGKFICDTDSCSWEDANSNILIDITTQYKTHKIHMKQNSKTCWGEPCLSSIKAHTFIRRPDHVHVGAGNRDIS